MKSVFDRTRWHIKYSLPCRMKYKTKLVKCDEPAAEWVYARSKIAQV